MDFIRVLTLLRAFEPLCKRYEQITSPQILEITEEILKRDNPNVLVFGIGADSKYWATLANTLFIEDNEKWISPEYDSVSVKYNCRHGIWSDSITYPFGWEKVPKKDWDVIFIDGPAGSSSGTPGRQQSIWIASQLKTSHTSVFLHDCKREWEQICYQRYLGKPTSMLGDLAKWI